MEKLKSFKIAENHSKFDEVELYRDKSNDVYIVKWKWSVMSEAIERKFAIYADAIEFYKERKNMAIKLN